MQVFIYTHTRTSVHVTCDPSGKRQRQLSTRAILVTACLSEAARPRCVPCGSQKETCPSRGGSSLGQPRQVAVFLEAALPGPLSATPDKVSLGLSQTINAETCHCGRWPACPRKLISTFYSCAVKVHQEPAEAWGTVSQGCVFC